MICSVSSIHCASLFFTASFCTERLRRVVDAAPSPTLRSCHFSEISFGLRNTRSLLSYPFPSEIRTSLVYINIIATHPKQHPRREAPSKSFKTKVGFWNSVCKVSGRSAVACVNWLNSFTQRVTKAMFRYKNKFHNTSFSSGVVFTARILLTWASIVQGLALFRRPS